MRRYVPWSLAAFFLPFLISFFDESSLRCGFIPLSVFAVTVAVGSALTALFSIQEQGEKTGSVDPYDLAHVISGAMAGVTLFLLLAWLGWQAGGVASFAWSGFPADSHCPVSVDAFWLSQAQDFLGTLAPDQLSDSQLDSLIDLGFDPEAR